MGWTSIYSSCPYIFTFLSFIPHILHQSIDQCLAWSRYIPETWPLCFLVLVNLVGIVYLSVFDPRTIGTSNNYSTLTHCVKTDISNGKFCIGNSRFHSQRTRSTKVMGGDPVTAKAQRLRSPKAGKPKKRRTVVGKDKCKFPLVVERGSSGC